MKEKQKFALLVCQYPYLLVVLLLLSVLEEILLVIKVLVLVMYGCMNIHHQHRSKLDKISKEKRKMTFLIIQFPHLLMELK